MFKPNKALLSLSLFLLFLLVYPSLFAQEDSITMTTYYPSPYGSYREMRAKRMAVGDDYIDGATYSWDSFPTTINADADLVVEGNVGIGTTAPGAVDNTFSNVLELGIGSKARPIFRITSASQSFIMGIDDASPTKLQIGPTSGSDYLPRNSANGITIDSSGNVGIGTTGPGQRLEVMAPTGSPAASGAVQNGILRIQGSTGGNGLDVGVLAGSPYGTWMQAGYKGGDLSINYPLLLNPNGGNVGIGTTSPGAKLDVAGNTILNSLQIYDRTLANGYLSISSGWDGVIRINPGTAGTMYFNRESGATKDFHVWNGVSTEVFTILGSNGNVGIGTTSPGVKLDVAANTAIRVGQAYLSSGGNYAHLATNEWHNGSAWTATAAGILLQLSGTNAVVYYHDGSGTHTIWASCASTAGWTAGSSKIYKQNIKRLSDSDYEAFRKQFRAINLFSYNRKDTPQESEVGFISEYAPDLILGSDKTQVTLMKAIGYLATIAKGQENVITSLQNEIEGLKAKITGLEGKVEKIVK